MTNLSEELCKVCGMEAQQFTKNFKTREEAARFGAKITGIPKFRGNKFDIGSYTDNQSIYQVHWKEYPDFTRPENFVRLLEVGITTPEGYIFTTVEILRNEGFLIFTGRESFLEQLLNYISMRAKFSKYIKLAIKSVGWLYD